MDVIENLVLLKLVKETLKQNLQPIIKEERKS